MIRCCKCDKQYPLVLNRSLLTLPVILCPYCGFRHTVDFKPVKDQSAAIPIDELRLTEGPPVYQVARFFANTGSGDPLADDDTSVTDYDTANTLIIVIQVDEVKGPWNAAYTLRWRNETDNPGGGFTALAATGEVKWATDTVLVNGNAITSQWCTYVPGGSTWQNGEEVEGAATCDAINLADEYYTEIAWAIDLADAGAGDQFTFELYDQTNGAAVATITPTITTASITDLSASGSDSVPVTDSTAVQFNELVASASDQAAVQDSTAIQLEELVAAVSDSVAAQDGVSALPELVLSASDSVGVDESTSSEVGGIPALTLSAADNVGVDESVSQDVVEVTDRSLSAQDQVTLGDGASAALDLLVLSGADSASVTENVSASLNELVVSLSDAVDVAGATANKLEPLLASVGDSIGVDEGIGSQLNELYASLADSVDTLEVVQGAISAPGDCSASDEVGVSDSVLASLDFLQASASDSTDISEEISSALDVLQVSVSDAVASTEQVSAALLIFREASASDSASVSDGAAAQLENLNVSVSDSISVGEALASLRDTIDAALQDAAAVSDAAYALLDVVPLQISDAVIIADSTNVIVYNQEVMLSISDSVGITEGYPIRTIPDPTKALGHKSSGSDAGHKSTGLKSE